MDKGLDEHLTERMCIVTREVMDEDALIRFVRGPDGQAVPDLQRKLPGRGVWYPNATGFRGDQEKPVFPGFRAETKASPTCRTIGLLRKLALSYFSLAKKAGVAVSGNSKVEEMVTKNLAQIILHALEAQPDGRRKIDKLAAPDVKIINIFHVDELDLAFGRSNVIHAAVGRGRLAEKLLLAVQRIERYDASLSV